MGKKSKKTEKIEMTYVSDVKADVNIVELIKAEEELSQLNAETNKRSFLYNLIDGYFEKQGAREKHLVNRKKYIWLSLLTGIVGGHRFYEKRYKLAILYLAFCWTGIPLAMAIMDWMIVVPMEADENGNILI